MRPSKCRRGANGRGSPVLPNGQLPKSRVLGLLTWSGRTYKNISRTVASGNIPVPANRPKNLAIAAVNQMEHNKNENRSEWQLKPVHTRRGSRGGVSLRHGIGSRLSPKGEGHG